MKISVYRMNFTDLIFHDRSALKLRGARFLSMAEVDSLLDCLVNEISSSCFRPDFVVGVLRGGYYPAKRVGKTLGVPVALIDVGRPREARFRNYSSRERPSFNSERRRIPCIRPLFIDDEIRTGQTFDVATAELGKINDFEGMKTAVIASFPGCRPDYLVREFESIESTPFVYPWELRSPSRSEYLRACMVQPPSEQPLYIVPSTH